MPHCCVLFFFPLAVQLPQTRYVAADFAFPSVIKMHSPDRTKGEGSFLASLD